MADPAGEVPEPSGSEEQARLEQKARDDAAGERIGKGCLIGCFGLIVLAFVLIMVAPYLGGDSGGSRRGDSPEMRRIGAENACQDWVADQLKAPSTAEFSNVSSTGLGPWTVRGDVDAQNSFGAMIRNSWTCDIRLDGDMFRGRATLAGN